MTNASKSMTEHWKRCAALQGAHWLQAVSLYHRATLLQAEEVAAHVAST